MWIIPSSLQQSLAIAPESVASKEELNDRLAHSEPLLMWKSKPLSSKTFWLAWKRAFWMRHLSGQILKPSMHDLFVERYTASLADIHVNHSALLATEKEQKTQDTCGRTLNEISGQLNLFGASSKTSADTLVSDTEMSDKVWKDWVTQLRKESLQRRKSAHRTNGNDCSYSPSEKIAWATSNTMDQLPPRSQEGAIRQALGARKGRMRPANLREQVDPVVTEVYQVMNWPTPSVSTGDYQNQKNGTKAFKLHGAVKNWCTPVAAMYRGIRPNSMTRKTGKSRENDRLDHQLAGQQDRMNNSTNGKNPEQLNPAWVAQLMGTTLEKTFFVPMAMELLSKRQS